MTLMKKLLLPFLLLICTAAYAGDGARRVVIIGDSITDGNWGCVYNYKKTSAERSSTDMNHIYGHSYVMFIATHYQSRKPEREYQFFNRGFSGNKLCDLAVRELCKEFGAVCIPFDTMFRELIEKQPRPSFWIWDGIHPTPVGHRRMAKLWIRKVGRL